MGAALTLEASNVATQDAPFFNVTLAVRVLPAHPGDPPTTHFSGYCNPLTDIMLGCRRSASVGVLAFRACGRRCWYYSFVEWRAGPATCGKQSCSVVVGYNGCRERHADKCCTKGEILSRAVHFIPCISLCLSCHTSLLALLLSLNVFEKAVKRSQIAKF